MDYWSLVRQHRHLGHDRMIDMICICILWPCRAPGVHRSAIVAGQILNGFIGHADAGYIGRRYIEI